MNSAFAIIYIACILLNASLGTSLAADTSDSGRSDLKNLVRIGRLSRNAHSNCNAGTIDLLEKQLIQRQTSFDEMIHIAGENVAERCYGSLIEYCSAIRSQDGKLGFPHIKITPPSRHSYNVVDSIDVGKCPPFVFIEFRGDTDRRWHSLVATNRLKQFSLSHREQSSKPVLDAFLRVAKTSREAADACGPQKLDAIEEQMLENTMEPVLFNYCPAATTQYFRDCFPAIVRHCSAMLVNAKRNVNAHFAIKVSNFAELEALANLEHTNGCVFSISVERGNFKTSDGSGEVGLWKTVFQKYNVERFVMRNANWQDVDFEIWTGLMDLFKNARVLEEVAIGPISAWRQSQLESVLPRNVVIDEISSEMDID